MAAKTHKNKRYKVQCENCYSWWYFEGIGIKKSDVADHFYCPLCEIRMQQGYVYKDRRERI